MKNRTPGLHSGGYGMYMQCRILILFTFVQNLSGKMKLMQLKKCPIFDPYVWKTVTNFGYLSWKFKTTMNHIVYLVLGSENLLSLIQRKSFRKTLFLKWRFFKGVRKKWYWLINFKLPALTTDTLKNESPD